MAEKTKLSKNNSHYYYTAAFAVILLLLVIRFLRLDIDPPYFFYGFSQAHLTDPYHLTFFARNAVLFGDWNPFDYYRWDIFKFSMVSGFSYMLFSFFGVSRITANLTGLFLNIGGLFLFLIGLTHLRPKRESVITCLLLLFSSLLIFYGRLPFLENGLILFCGAIFFVFLKYYDKIWGQFLVGFLVALAALAGKLFGLLLIAPVVVSLIYIYRKKSIIPIAVSIAGVFTGGLIYIFSFYGGDISSLMNYYTEQTVGIYGTPQGIFSPIVIILKLIKFGAGSGFFLLHPFYIILACLGLAKFVFKINLTEKYRPEQLPFVFSVIWLIVSVFVLALHNYRPLRYEIFLILPLTVFAVYFIGSVFEKPKSIALRNKLIKIPLLFFAFWYLVTQIYLFINPDGFSESSGVAIEFVVTVLLFLILYVVIPKIKLRWLSLIALPLVIGLFIKQGVLIYEGLVLPGTYLKDYNKELTELIDKDAVLTGPYAPAFTIDNDLKGIIYIFGLANIEKDLFERFPITHIVTDVGNWNLAPREYPFLSKAFSVRRMKIRDGSVELFRLPTATVPLSLSELAGMAFLRKEYALSLNYSEKFVEKYPDNLSGRFGLLFAYFALSKTEKLTEQINFVKSAYPDNFRMHMFVRYIYQNLYQRTNESQYIQLADYHFKQAKKINPTLNK